MVVSMSIYRGGQRWGGVNKYISEIIYSKHGVSCVGEAVHEQKGIVVETVDVGEVEEDVSVSFPRVGGGYVGWC